MLNHIKIMPYYGECGLDAFPSIGATSGFRKYAEKYTLMYTKSIAQMCQKRPRTGSGPHAGPVLPA